MEKPKYQWDQSEDDDVMSGDSNCVKVIFARPFSENKGKFVQVIMSGEFRDHLKLITISSVTAIVRVNPPLNKFGRLLSLQTCLQMCYRVEQP
jgi:hypothetical protein